MANINQVYQILNLATKEAWGSEAIQVTDTRSLIAMGDYVMNSSTSASRDVFVNALSDVIGKTIFVSRELRLDDLGLSTDYFTFGAYLRKIRVKPKLTEHNTEYDLGNEEFNPFEIKKPTVDEKLFSKHGTYALIVSVTDDQIFTAFTSESEMMSFYSLIYKQLDDCIRRGELAYDRLALANFIAEKFLLQADTTNQSGKLHCINILKLYNDEFNKSLKASKCLTDSDFLKFFASKIMEYKGYMASDTSIFNASDGYNSQTPAEYLKMFVLRALDSKLNAYLYSDTYHDEMVKIAGYKVVDFWQGISDGVTNPFDATATSKINIKVASDSTGSTSVEQGGILAVLMDKDAVATCYKRPKAESWRIPTKGTQNYRAVTQMMINDMYENGLIFYVDDVDDNISDLAFSSGSLSPAFTSATTSYTLSIAAATSSSELTFDLDEGATAIVKKGTTKITPTQGVYNITGLADNDKITVEVQKFDIKTVYTITVDKADS